MNKIFASSMFLLGAVVSFSANAKGNIGDGKALTAKYNCASCHGVDFNNPTNSSYPKLAGQHSDYLEHALVSYQRGADGVNGRGNAIMGAMAKSLSHKDMADIAAYLSSLQGTLVMVK